MKHARHAHINRLAKIALFSAIALVLSYIELAIALPFVLPGIKLGLANAAVIVALFVLDTRSAIYVGLVKVLAAGFLFGSPMMLAYSAGGTVLALLVMIGMKHIPGISVVVISMASAIAHNIGQLLVAAALFLSPAVFLSFPPLALAACITGALSGVLANVALNGSYYQAHNRPVINTETLSIQPGEHLAFVGANGSGKTSCALQLAGLAEQATARSTQQPRTQPTPAAPPAAPPNVEQPFDGRVGIAFQDPNNQLVATRVCDDVAFGPENCGVDVEEMQRIVYEALVAADAEALCTRSVSELSGGQKQRVAVAGLLALAPGLVVFDETSAMFNPQARQTFAQVVSSLCAQNIAVITITHDMDEAFCANRIAVFSEGTIVAVEKPAALLQTPEVLEQSGLELPSTAAVAQHLQHAGVAVSLTNSKEELISTLRNQTTTATKNRGKTTGATSQPTKNNAATQSTATRQTRETETSGKTATTHTGSRPKPAGNTPEQAASTSKPASRTVVSFGIYQAGTSFVHNLTPQTKLTFVALYIVATFMAQGPIALGIMTGIALGALAASNTGIKQAFALSRPFLWLLILVALMDILFTSNGTVLITAGPLAITTGGLSFAATSVVRFVCMLLGTSCLMYTTSPTAITDGIAIIARPLEHLGLHTNNAVLTISLTIRFIPVMIEEFNRIKQAQQSRLANFSGTIRQRMSAYGTAFAPLFTSALRRSDSLALAIENRLYDERAHRTCYRTYPLHRSDAAIIALSVVAVIIAATSLTL